MKPARRLDDIGPIDLVFQVVAAEPAAEGVLPSATAAGKAGARARSRDLCVELVFVVAQLADR